MHFTALSLLTNAVVVPNPHYRVYTAHSNPIPMVFLRCLSPFPQYYRKNCPQYRGITAIPIPMSVFITYPPTLKSVASPVTEI